MTVTVSTAGWNETRTIVPVIKYYLDICKFDRFIYYDNFSTDDTLSQIDKFFSNDSRVIVRNTPYMGHMPVQEVYLMNDTMNDDDHDIFIWIDSDEIIYCKDFQKHFKDLKSRKKYYSAMRMTNVFNSANTFNRDYENIIDNFEYGNTDTVNPVYKTPILIKDESIVCRFGGGHHSVNINGEEIGNFPICQIKEEDFIDQDIHLFHFTYIDEEMYHNRKTLGRARNMELGIDNSWYNGYWNMGLDEIRQHIESSKSCTNCLPISSYL